MTCIETYKQCKADRDAKIEKVIAEREEWETHAELAEKAGIPERTMNRRLKVVTNPSNVANVTEPTELETRLTQLPEADLSNLVKTERVKAIWTLWKELSNREQAKLIAMIVNFMQGKKVP